MWNRPYCLEPVRLTWKRYFTEPGLRHKCSHCGRISRVDGALSTKLWTLRTLGTVLGGLPLAIAGYHFGHLASPFGLIVGGLATGLPIDKYLDERHRKLTGVEDEKQG